MITESWKSIFRSEKAVFNLMVSFLKQTDSNFKEDSIEQFFRSYYHSICICIPEPSSVDLVRDSFEILILLIHKGYLRDPKGEKEQKILSLLGKLKSPLNENLKMSISYIINTISKIKPSAETKFIQRLEFVAEHLRNIEELKKALIVLTWLSGHPEYRVSALKVFNDLPVEIKNLIHTELGVASEEFVPYFVNHPFGKFPINEKNEIRYKQISGYPLLGGEFFTLPKLKKGEEGLLVFANGKNYQIDFDLFGDHVFLSNENAIDLPSTSFSPYWKAVVSKVFPLEMITSHFETESYLVVTNLKSYSVYIFYRVSNG